VIRMFVAPPGAGKSYAALKDIVLELVYGHRVVRTNLAVKPAELNAWLSKEYPDWSGDINVRLLPLTREQCGRFWCFRGPGVEIKDSTREEYQRKVFPDLGIYRGDGVLYVIDEAHLSFDSRDWAANGLGLTYYNSQHRKLNDECIYVTQFENLVDVRVRGFAQEFVYFRNNGIERVWTWFQMPAYFTSEGYRRPPRHGEAPMYRRRERMDFSLATCYDTTEGVGITGRAMPEVRAKKGLAVYWLGIPVVLVGAVMFFVPEFFTKALMGATKSSVVPVKPAAVAKPVAGEGAAVGMGGGKSSTMAQAIPNENSGASVPVCVVSYAYGGQSAVVWLSDGSVLTKESGLLAISPWGALGRDGRRYPMRANVVPALLDQPRPAPQAQVRGRLRRH